MSCQSRADVNWSKTICTELLKRLSPVLVFVHRCRNDRTVYEQEKEKLWGGIVVRYWTKTAFEQID